MAAELEKPRITEIQVRMDCNGCVQKIKKALHGINGIYELYIDFPQQKITIVGRADLEKIAKAIKKTRKSAVICSHTEQQPDPPPPPQPSEQPPEGGAPPPDEAAQPEETAKDPLPENQPAEEKQSPETADTDKMQTVQSSKSSKPKDVEEVHVIYHYPPDYGYRYSYGSSSMSHGYAGQWNSQPSDPRFRQEPPPSPIYVSHSYNSYKASPHVTRYEYVQSPPRYTHYATTEDYYHYTDDYHNGNNNNNGNIDSVFSEENPNSCTIV